MLRKRYIVTWCAMTTRTLRPVNMSARLEDVFADAEGSGFGLALDAGIQRNLDDLLLKGERCIGDGDRERPELEVSKEAGSNGNNAERKPRKTLPKLPLSLFFAILSHSFEGKGRP